MRRWLALFLLLVVPLQFSFAVASAYCQHESGSAARHFGHHLHHHQDGAAKGDSHGDSGKGAAKLKAAHDDCGVCHMNLPQLLLQDFTLAAPTAASPQAWAAARPLSSADPGRIERPNWTTSL